MSANSDGTNPSLVDLRQADVINLTSFRRDGTPVSTKVHLVVDDADGRAYARTYDASWKFKRIRRNPVVELAPTPAASASANPSPAHRASVRLLAGEEARQAGRRLAHRHPILHGWLIPAYHRLRGWRTIEMELTALS